VCISQSTHVKLQNSAKGIVLQVNLLLCSLVKDNLVGAQIPCFRRDGFLPFELEFRKSHVHCHASTYTVHVSVIPVSGLAKVVAVLNTGAAYSMRYWLEYP
jgi:hypothetical protein